MSRKAATLFVFLIVVLASVACNDDTETIIRIPDAPASLDGLRYDMTVTASEGALEPAGNFRISFSGANHDIQGDGTIPNSSGTFTYAEIANVGTVTANDIVMGNPVIINLIFSTSSKGIFTLEAPNGSQTGTFVEP